jgi:hypothetical protein
MHLYFHGKLYVQCTTVRFVDRKGVMVQRHAPAAFYSRERPSNYCRGGWVGPWVDLDRCEKSRPHRDSIPEPSSP